MTFAFYILDPFDARFIGTNDEAIAREYAVVEDYYVLSTHTNEWLMADGTALEVEEAPNIER